MKTISLEIWRFFAVVTVGFAATGCAVETGVMTDPNETDEVAASRPVLSATACNGGVAEEFRSQPIAVKQSPIPGAPTLAQDQPQYVATESRANPDDHAPGNPCPGQAAAILEAW